MTLIKVTYDSKEATSSFLSSGFHKNPCMFFHCSINLTTSRNIATFTSEFSGHHHPLK